MSKRVVVLIVEYIKWIVLIPVGGIHYVIGIVQYLKKAKREIPPPPKIGGIIPIILDRYKPAGSIDSHYFLQDIHVAKHIMQEKPVRHFDVGSRVDGFISHLLAGLEGEVTIIDVRPMPIKIEHLNFIQANATNLKEIADNSIESLSSLHAVEHFGLGRYGDNVDPKACFTAMRSLQRVVKRNGKLYFSVPIGRTDAVYFNSHRIFKAQTILKIFDEMELEEFSYIHNYQIKTIDGKKAMHLIQNNAIAIENYDCGIFVFRKK